MKLQQIIFTLLFILLLAGCGTDTGTSSQLQMPPAATLATATAKPAVTAVSTSQPMPAIDPFVQARQIIEQAAFAAPTGWQVQLCEGDAAVLCVSDGQTNVGYAELNIYPLTGFSIDHPNRTAANELPAEATTYTLDHLKTARQALTYLAEEYLTVIADDRAITYPDDMFTSLAMAPVQLGALPALAFGFEHSNPTGEIVERYLSIAAFDQQFIYWFGINYDSANVSTFVSDTAVSQFAPSFYEIGASLPLPLPMATAQSN